MTRRYIVLDNAFYFECPDCGLGNFVRSEPMQFDSEEEYHETCVDLGIIESWQPAPPPGAIVVEPDSVICSYCNETYEARHPCDDEEEPNDHVD